MAVPNVPRPPGAPPPAGASASKRPVFTLSGIHRGRKKAPDRVLLYGIEGVGKSTWAASAPEPIFLASEDGINHLDVASFSDPRPDTYEAVLAAIDWLATADHPFRTLVVDSIDWVEHMVRDHVIATNRHEKTGAPWTPQDYDAYGRGVNMAADEFRRMIVAMERMQAAKAMDVILVAHALVKTVRNPVGEDYMIYSPKLSGIAIPALFVEWSEAVCFANYDITVATPKGAFGKGKARIGDRVLYTTPDRAWVAKNRHGLPGVINLDYDEYVRYRDAGRDAGEKQISDEIATLRESLTLPPDKAAKLDQWIASAGTNIAHLTSVLEFLRGLAAPKEGA